MCWKWHQYCWIVVDCTHGVCGLSEEDDRMIPWHNAIHSIVDKSTPPGSNCGAKGSCLLPEDSVPTKGVGSSEVQSHRKLKGESCVWELPGWNWMTYRGMFLPWCLLHTLFPGARPDQGCWFWPWVCETAMENTATCCIHVAEKGGNEAICCESI